MNLIVITVLSILSTFSAYLCFKILDSTAIYREKKKKKNLKITGALAGFLITFIVLFSSYQKLEKKLQYGVESKVLLEKTKSFYRQNEIGKKRVYENEIGLRYLLPSDYINLLSEKVYYRNLLGILDGKVYSTITIGCSKNDKIFNELRDTTNFSDKVDDTFKFVLKNIDNSNLLLSSQKIIPRFKPYEIKSERIDGYNNNFFWHKRLYQKSPAVKQACLQLHNFENKVLVLANITIENDFGEEAVNYLITSISIK